MAEIRLGKNESLDTALKRFKRSCAKAGVIAEVRKREHVAYAFFNAFKTLTTASVSSDFTELDCYLKING